MAIPDTHRQLDLSGFVPDDDTSSEEVVSSKITCRIESETLAILEIPATHSKLHLLMAGRQSHIKGRKTFSGKGFHFYPSQHNLDYIKENFDVEFFNLSLRKVERVQLPEKYTNFYESQTEAFKHQEDAMKFALKRKQFALFMEQGTGKTKVLLDYAGTLFEEDIIDLVIVIAPKGVHRQWIEAETPKHIGCSVQAIYWNKRVEFVHRMDNALTIYAFNYDALRTKPAQQQIELLLAEFETPMLILDESHKVKSSSSLRWKAIEEHLANNIEIKVALTGTPIAKNLVDEWAQLYLINKDILGLEKRQHFIDEYYATSGRYGNMVAVRNLERFKELTKDHVYRLKKTELDIEEKTYSRWIFDMNPKQKKMYRQALNSILLDLQKLTEDETKNGKLVINHHLARMQKLQQISNGWIVDSEGKTVDLIPFQTNPRVQALIECIESKNGAQIIIWCKYIHDVTTIVNALNEYGYTSTFIDGRTKNQDIPERTNLFFSKQVQLLVTTPAKLGTGYNLQIGGCTDAIYYSNSENSIDRWQSEDRIHRIGTKGICNYTDIVGTNTRDSRILANLQAKKSLADYVLDDIVQELSELEDELQ